MRMPVTGVVDADTSAALVRHAAFFRYAGLLAGALGVAGLIKSVGGLTADSYLEALDRFREMLGKSADPNLNQALDALRQVWRRPNPPCKRAPLRPSTRLSPRSAASFPAPSDRCWRRPSASASTALARESSADFPPRRRAGARRRGSEDVRHEAPPNSEL